jgi:hypothetical protein
MCDVTYYSSMPQLKFLNPTEYETVHRYRGMNMPTPVCSLRAVYCLGGKIILKRILKN